MTAPERSAPRPVVVLPDDLANQIAAGEVVERPASVVKELCENAVDAGARRVHVDVESGGVALTRVADDGSGMAREDARLALLRHATSKIGTLDDLRRIETFGFRGEALPSIASVSKFTLRTRRAGEDEGTEVALDGGGVARVGPCGCATGTTVEVRELFFNVPARRKFLRAVGTELAHVTEVVQALALAHPALTVVLARDGRVVREWPRAADLEERARAVFEGEELCACRGERGALGAEAFLSRPERARAGATGLSMFVNGRPVRDRALARAVAQAYGSVLEPGRYPIGAVFLDLPHDLVDVNVHPQKAEVRFADARGIADALYRIISTGLAAGFGLPPPDRRFGDRKRPPLYDERGTGALSTWAWASAPGQPEADPWALAGDAGADGAPAPEDGAPAPEDGAPAPEDGAPASRRRSAGVPPADAGAGTGMLAAAETIFDRAAYGTDCAPPPGKMPYAALRFIAQVRRTYMICEANDGLYIIDQHAAAERVSFHRLRRSFDAREVATQALLFPVVVQVPPSQVALVEEAQEQIARSGVDMRPAGHDAVAVHAVPKVLGRASPERLAHDLLAELGRVGGRAFSSAIDLALATMACHGSLRAGDAIAPEEAAALLRALDEVDFAGHCPHGRPIVMRIGWNELETRVGRR